MEVLEAMRTIGTCRFYKPDPVPDEVIYKAVEAARFAPQGGNRQPLRFLVVRDPEKKKRLGELYLPWWKGYFEAAEEGTRNLGEFDSARKALLAADDFAENFGNHPVIIVACSRVDDLHLTDADLDRPTVVGGASIYPMAQNLCIALRDQGVATSFTTLLCHSEPEVKELLGIPEDFLTACHIAAGYPEKGFPKRLTRLPVEELVYVDTFGESIAAPQAA